MLLMVSCRRELAMQAGPVVGVRGTEAPSAQQLSTRQSSGSIVVRRRAPLLGWGRLAPGFLLYMHRARK